MSQSNKGLEVKVGRTELKAQDLVFIHPAYGPNTFSEVKEQLSKDGLVMPTMPETASLVYAAWQNPEEKYSKEILDLLRDKWLWVNNGVLWTPEGVYVQDNPNIKDSYISMNKRKLESKLSNKSQNGVYRSKDGTVRFTEYGFKLGKQTPTELAENRFVIALAGEEGAEKLAKSAEKYSKQPYVFGFNKVNEDIARVSALGSYWDDDWLVVDGLNHVVRDGFAFGVRGSARKK